MKWYCAHGNLEKSTESELQGKFIHIWSAVGKDKTAKRGTIIAIKSK